MAAHLHPKTKVYPEAVLGGKLALERLHQRVMTNSQVYTLGKFAI
jgi:hypothetical protein